MNGFDIKKLVAAVKRKLSDDGISAAAAARLAGVKESTFNRLKNGDCCADSENLLSVCQWLNVPFERFTTDKPERVVFYEEGETLDKIEALIAVDSNLEESDRRKLTEIFRSQYRIIANLGK